MAKNPLVSRFVKFAVVGGSGTLIAWAMVWLLTEKAGLWYMFSVMLATVVTTITNFTLNNLWTFKDRRATNEIR